MAPQHSELKSCGATKSQLEKLWRHKILIDNLKHITQDPMIQGGMLPVFFKPFEDQTFFSCFLVLKATENILKGQAAAITFHALWTKKSVELMWNNVVLMRKWSQLTLLRLLHTKKDPAAEHWWGPGNSCLLDIARLTLNRLICLLMKKVPIEQCVNTMFASQTQVSQ